MRPTNRPVEDGSNTRGRNGLDQALAPHFCPSGRLQSTLDLIRSCVGETDTAWSHVQVPYLCPRPGALWEVIRGVGKAVGAVG